MRNARNLDFPLEEYIRRLRVVQELLSQSKMDALFLTMGENIEYLSGFRVVSLRLLFKAFWLVVPETGEPILIVDSIHETNADRTCWLDDIRIWGCKGKTNIDRLVEIFDDLKLQNKTVGMELGHGLRLNMSQLDYEEIRKRLLYVKFVNATDLLGQWKMVKSSYEVERIRRASQITSNAVQKAFAEIRASMTEREIIATVVCEMLQQGSESIYNAANLMQIALQVNRIDQVNPCPIDRMIVRGDLVRFDGGAVYRS